MASHLARLELWDGLDAVSGTVRLHADVPWTRCVMSQREDGDDTLAVTIPLAHAAAASVAPGTVWRGIGEDATVWEFIVTVVDEDVVADTLSTTAAAARTWLTTSAITIADETRTDAPSTLVSALTVQAGWPAWVTAGTIQPTTPVSVSWANETGLSALLKIVAAVDATLADGDPPCVLRFRRASDSSYVMDILTTPATGTAHLLQGKNLLKIGRRRDATTGTAITSYQLQVADLYRHDATSYPRDNLAVYQTVRLESSSLSLDTSTVRISEVVTDFANTLGTTVQIGEPRRRLLEQTAEIAAATVPPTPVLTVEPGTMSDTEKVYTLGATISAGTVTVRVVPRGTTASGDTYGAISDGTSAAMAQGEILTVARPATGGPPASVVVEAFGSDGGSATVVLEIPAQDPPVLLTISATQTASASDTISYDVIAVDPLGTATITIADDGGSATTGPSGDSWVIDRPAPGDPPLAVKFTASATGRVSQSVTVVVPAQDVSAGTVPPSIDAFYSPSVDTGADEVDLEWTASNEPASETYDLQWRLQMIDPSTGAVTDEETGTETGITTPYAFGAGALSGALDVVTKGTSGWHYAQLACQLRMKNTVPAVVATADTTVYFYGIYSP